MGGDQRETDLSWLLQVRVHLAERTNKKSPSQEGLGINGWDERNQTRSESVFCR